MRAAVWFSVGVVGAGLAAGGCDWRDFDTLQAETPAIRVGPPSGYAAPNDFGSVILALTPPADGSAAARFLGSAIDQTGLAIVDINAAGQASSQNVTGPDLDNLDAQPITAMAEIPGTGAALLGVPSLTGGSLLTIDLTTLVVSPFATTPAEAQLGVGVAAGNLGGTTMPDYVAVSGTSVHVYLDGASSNVVSSDPTACPIALSTSLPGSERINRAVAIGNLTGSGVQIAVGTPVLSGGPTGGSVTFFTVGAGAITCPQILAAPSTTDIQFGQALAIGDFDGDGTPDLLVGAPPNHAYLYKGPVSASAVPTATITDPSTGGAFGAAMVALNLDGKLGDEALIADPQATVGGETRAGNVLIYTGPKLATTVVPTLADFTPTGGEAYGSAVAALPFCPTMPCPANPPRLPLVGAASQTFTYFTLGLGPADPRVK